MAASAATADAAPASTQAPPATTHAGGGAARGEGGKKNGSDNRGEGGRDNGSPNGNNSGGDDESKRDGEDDEGVSKRGGGTGDSKRGDGEEEDGQDQTAQDAPPGNAPGTQALQPGRQEVSLEQNTPGKVATHLTLDEVASHVQQGHLPTCRVGPSGYGNLRPTTRTIPPRHIEDGPSFIVGVPADARTLHEGAFVQDGYGGTESLMMFNGLSNRDLESLGAFHNPHKSLIAGVRAH
jgi:hypothetical protein